MRNVDLNQIKLMEILENQKKIIQKFNKLSDLSTIKFSSDIALKSSDFNAKVSALGVQINKIFNSGLAESIQKVGKEIAQKVRANPEMQFAFITDLESLNIKSSEDLKNTVLNVKPDDEINEKENVLKEHLLPYLERLELESLWFGAEYALDSKNNPDRLRHCLISLRTILEHLIDEKLAPKEELANHEMFRREFKDYRNGKESIENIRIKRSKKIEYFTSKIEFGMLDEFTKKDIDFVCSCYSVLCDIHKPEIGLEESQVRSLKVKTGITIWLLGYIYEILNE